MHLLGDFQLISDKFIIHEMPGHFTKFNKLIWDVINCCFHFGTQQQVPVTQRYRKLQITQSLRARS
jgi:hypothetical protein